MAMIVLGYRYYPDTMAATYQVAACRSHTCWWLDRLHATMKGLWRRFIAGKPLMEDDPGTPYTLKPWLAAGWLTSAMAFVAGVTLTGAPAGTKIIP